MNNEKAMDSSGSSEHDNSFINRLRHNDIGIRDRSDNDYCHFPGIDNNAGINKYSNSASRNYYYKKTENNRSHNSDYFRFHVFSH
jgi:hypothetical protein